jgi:DnaJ-class molecular chaperone
MITSTTPNGPNTMRPHRSTDLRRVAKGNGKRPGDLCPHCLGTGVLGRANPADPMEAPCFNCNGEGRLFISHDDISQD